MKKIIILLSIFIAFVSAKEKPTHYVNGTWYSCVEYTIEHQVFKDTTIVKKLSNGSEEWYDYDSKGNLIHVKLSNGTEEWIDYDSKGNRIHERLSSGDEWWYDYDSKGKLIHMKSSNGSELWIDYDSKGNLMHIKLSSGFELWYKLFVYPNKKLQCRVNEHGKPL